MTVLECTQKQIAESRPPCLLTRPCPPAGKSGAVRSGSRDRRQGMLLADKKVVVVGLGKTGAAVARFLKKSGAAVTVSDAAGEDRLGPDVRTLREMGVHLELGGHRLATFLQAQMVVISPGVAHTIEPVARAREKGIPVMGEIELACRFISRPIVAVTGTNGKTTTAELIGRMLRDSGIEVFVGGNIGRPLIGYADGTQSAQIIVAEISSFQLDTIQTFRPAVAVLLNITADHLDRYPDFDAYADSKMKIFENQQPADIAIINGADPLICSLAQRIKSRRWIYPNAAADQPGALLNGRRLYLRTGHGLQDTGRQSDDGLQCCLDLGGIRLRGRHNLENACAASLAALAAGADLKSVGKTLMRFEGLPHRLEYVATLEDVDYFNDSKATNVDAVARALTCFSGPVVLIMGGIDKGGDFRMLLGALRRSVKLLIVMGEAAGRIRAILGSSVPTMTAASMTEALDEAHRAAAAGDTVLLSPGCASFDMYEDYTRRGDDFRRQVARLQKIGRGKK